MKAQLIYWFPLRDGVQDGGSHRAKAWREALQQMGYEVVETPIHAVPPNEWRQQGRGRRARLNLTRLKQSLAPMPLNRRAPRIATDVDLVVATVPAVFSSVLKSTTAGQRVVLDWMDLWSATARSFRHAKGLAGLGGLLQAGVWRVRERRLFAAPVMHSFAGHGDLSDAPEGNRHWWIPTPVVWSGRTSCRPEGISRIGFIGNLHYRPNAVALETFIAQHLADMAGKGIQLVAAGPGTERLDATTPNLVALGQVDEVSDFYAGIDAVVVPVDVGGGIKVKAIEGLAHGVPVFGTDHVRSGFSPELRSYILDIEDLEPAGVPSTRAFMTEAQFEGALGPAAFRDRIEAMLGTGSQ